MTQSNALALPGRILLAVLFILSGVGKFAASAATQGYIASVGLPAPMLALIVAITVELGGGILILFGYKTRLASLALAAFVLATAVIFHNDFGDQNQMNHFMKNIALMGGLLVLAASGPGRFSLDARRKSEA